MKTSKKINKKVVIATSCVLLTSIGLSAGIGVAINNQVNKVNIGNSDVKPGEIKFDENGKLIIPKLYDAECPSGIYKNPLPNIDLNSHAYEDITSPKAKANVQKINASNKEFLKNLLDKDVTVKIDHKTKLVIDNILPNNKIMENESFMYSSLTSDLYDLSLENSKTHLLSNEEVKNYNALCGINIAKEYNDYCNTDFVAQYGGGGRPSIDVPPVDSITKYPSNLTVDQSIEMYTQDKEIRAGFLVGYSAIIPVLTILQIVSSVFGQVATFLSIMSDLIFSGIELYNQAKIVGKSKDTLNLIKSLKSDGKELFDDLKKLPQQIKEDEAKRKKLLSTVKDMDASIIKSMKYVDLAISLLALVVKPVMHVLEDVMLIANHEKYEK